MSLAVPPWVERFRPYLHALSEGQLGPAVAARVDLSGVVQQTLAECATADPPADPEAARRRVRVAFLNNLMDAARHATAAKRDVRLEVSLGSSAGPLATLAAPSTPSRQAIRRESEEQLVQALADLPDDQRTAVVLHHLMELPVGRVAAEMGKTEAAAGGLLRRGLARLRELLADPPSAG